MDRIRRLRETMKKLIEGKFSGYIKINFSQGSLGRVEKCEEFDVAAILNGEKEESEKGTGENHRHDI